MLSHNIERNLKFTYVLIHKNEGMFKSFLVPSHNCEAIRNFCHVLCHNKTGYAITAHKTLWSSAVCIVITVNGCESFVLCLVMD